MDEMAHKSLADEVEELKQDKYDLSKRIRKLEKKEEELKRTGDKR